jgi:hypothetical protein
MSRKVVASSAAGASSSRAASGRVVRPSSAAEDDGEEGAVGGGGGSSRRSGGGGRGGGRARRERVDYDEKEAMEITTDADVAVFSTFDEMGLKEDLLRGIYAYGALSFASINSLCW